LFDLNNFNIDNFNYDSFFSQANVNDSDIEIILNPEQIEPFQKTQIKITSNSIDLNRYKITWNVNGTEVLSGIGERVLFVDIGDYGSVTSVDINIDQNPGIIIKRITLAPQDVTLLWEAVDSHVPVFYQGRKLPVRESLIRMVALPNFSIKGGTILPANQGVYIWRRNGDIVKNAGGYSKMSILLKQNKLRRSETIRVIVSDQDNEKKAEKTLTIPLFNPEIHFYRRDSITGIRSPLSVDKGLKVKTDEVLLEAEPYYMSTEKPLFSNLEFNWQMNNKPLAIYDITKKNQLIIQNPNKKGITNFSLDVSSTENTYQETSKSLQVETQ
jgi:hypothetical protein